MTDAILISGGLDSIALAAMMKPKIGITCDYGQLPAEGEIRAATQACADLGIQHHIITADCRSLGSGDLAGATAMAGAPAPEWWPFRNQLLITLAAMAALRLGATRLLIGTVKSDSFHADGTSRFVQAINELCRMQEGEISVEAPAIHMTSADLVRQSKVDLSTLAWGHSCHVAPWACGLCRGCYKHRQVMQELGYGPY